MARSLRSARHHPGGSLSDPATIIARVAVSVSELTAQPSSILERAKPWHPHLPRRLPGDPGTLPQLLRRLSEIPESTPQQLRL